MERGQENNRNIKKSLAGIEAALTLSTGGVVGADRAIDPYVDIGTHQVLDIKHYIQQGERVEIAKDKAEMTLRGWSDEYAIKITPQIPSSTLGASRKDFVAEGKRPLLSKRMEYKSGDVTAFIEPHSDTEFDIDFTLDKKPDTNVFTYIIEGVDEFDFFYQPELTQAEIDRGASRPENVVGSYAVYSKTKANHELGKTNYGTGKVMHIYRPKAIDADGDEVWSELNYNNGMLSVTVDQTFLDNATYPVTVDPTFGYTSQGASDDVIDSSSNDRMAGHKGASISGDVTEIAAYLKSSGGATNYQLHLYSDSSGTPNASLVGTSNQAISGSTYALRTGTLSYTMTSGDYWAIAKGFYNGPGTNVAIAYDTGGTSNFGASWDSTWSLNSNKYSIYTTYTQDLTGSTIEYDQSAGDVDTGVDLTVSADANFLVIGGASRDTTEADRNITAASFNGDSATEGVAFSNVSCSDRLSNELWYLPNPDTGSAYTTSITFAGAVQADFIGSISLKNVDTADPIDATSSGACANNNLASTTITTTVDDTWIVFIVSADSGSANFIEGTGTERVNVSDGSRRMAMYTQYAPTAGSYTVTAPLTASANWAMTAFSLNPETGGGGDVFYQEVIWFE